MKTAVNDSPHYSLKLFISGASRNSTRAINNLRRILEANFAGSYNLQIIDLYQDRSLAEKEQIVAVPLLIRKDPKPEQRLIGDMSNEERVISKLRIILADL
ncbi:MAG TPA: circadian clock KaiB family protein [Cyclobacteriaceae bacterium]|nr:circadian clock KaiB family protein [Cyclobacteriaceae bacterium]